MRHLIALISGALFGAGLLVSGMTNTQKVLGFLDFFGDWDPTLVFVMGGAIVPMAVAWAYTRGRKPLNGDSFPAPADPRLDRSLIVGGVLFGAGWGLVGLCPGPALASLSFGGIGGLGFLLAMLAGMVLAPVARRRLDSIGPSH
ncbi:hypothetical protein C1J03_14220 [Sulfitobacter sp. SK012]|uniref:DUF6691 family protein n=1 Tax=Sulfitobacter sp. SK012 TaxID=1389005 RepID=UPI000E0A95AA|nr:DUF6691 family protein [Sulfitobacter sp. SK012]AXI47070.1 hypothetical protein C1J03_14220 [Sulfitobacter sp. SK012]